MMNGPVWDAGTAKEFRRNCFLWNEGFPSQGTVHFMASPQPQSNRGEPSPTHGFRTGAKRPSRSATPPRNFLRSPKRKQTARTKNEPPHPPLPFRGGWRRGARLVLQKRPRRNPAPGTIRSALAVLSRAGRRGKRDDDAEAGSGAGGRRGRGAQAGPVVAGGGRPAEAVRGAGGGGPVAHAAAARGAAAVRQELPPPVDELPQAGHQARAHRRRRGGPHPTPPPTPRQQVVAPSLSALRKCTRFYLATICVAKKLC
jgi:hypothetical protein